MAFVFASGSCSFNISYSLGRPTPAAARAPRSPQVAGCLFLCSQELRSLCLNLCMKRFDGVLPFMLVAGATTAAAHVRHAAVRCVATEAASTSAAVVGSGAGVGAGAGTLEDRRTFGSTRRGMHVCVFSGVNAAASRASQPDKIVRKLPPRVVFHSGCPLAHSSSSPGARHDVMASTPSRPCSAHCAAVVRI